MSSFFNSPSGPPKPFKDLGKLCHDLLKKDFPTAGEGFDWKSEVTASSDHGTFSGNLQKTPKDGLNSGEVSYKFPSKFGEITTKIDLTKKIKLEHQKKNLLVKGFDLNDEIGAEFSKDTGSFSLSKFMIGGDYKRDWVNGSLAFNKLLGRKTDSVNLSGSLVVGTPEVALGASTEVNNSLDINKFDTTLFYSKSDLTATIFWKHKKGSGNTVGTNVYLKSLAKAKKLNLVVGGEFELKLSDGEGGQSHNPTITFGGSFTPDDSSSIKACLLSTGNMGIALTQQLSSSTSVTGAVNVDLMNPTAPNAFSYGLKFVLSLK